MSQRKTAKTVRRRRQYKIPMIVVSAIFLISIVPTTITLLSRLTDGKPESIPGAGHYFSAVTSWYSSKVEPVQELRVLAAFPTSWEGRIIDIDKNYSRFQNWYTDNLGLRDLMIRSKNELDYQLFRSSSRVYFGKGHDIYGRGIADREIPATEAILNSKEKIEYLHQNVVRFTNAMKAQGVTTIIVMPMQKQYFYHGRLPFFAPQLPTETNFMAFYESLKADQNLNMIDVFGNLQSIKDRYQIFYTQDFHWTDIAALSVAKETVNRIAKFEGADERWSHSINVQEVAFVGSDARFSARLNASGKVTEPGLVLDWPAVHQSTLMDPKATGLEFETDDLAGKGLLPATCMYGNSFGDGMLRAGIVDYFQKFTKIDRARPLTDIPDLVRGKCKYLIVQILDIQSGYWLSIK